MADTYYLTFITHFLSKVDLLKKQIFKKYPLELFYILCLEQINIFTIYNDGRHFSESREHVKLSCTPALLPIY
jgi:hypothetical protein